MVLELNTNAHTPSLITQKCRRNQPTCYGVIKNVRPGFSLWLKTAWTLANPTHSHQSGVTEARTVKWVCFYISEKSCSTSENNHKIPRIFSEIRNSIPKWQSSSANHNRGKPPGDKWRSRRSYKLYRVRDTFSGWRPCSIFLLLLVNVGPAPSLLGKNHLDSFPVDQCVSTVDWDPLSSCEINAVSLNKGITRKKKNSEYCVKCIL